MVVDRMVVGRRLIDKMVLYKKVVDKKFPQQNGN